jgi:hypothetical protein
VRHMTRVGQGSEHLRVLLYLRAEVERPRVDFLVESQRRGKEEGASQRKFISNAEGQMWG